MLMKKKWTLDQKIKLVKGFAKWTGTKKAYCAKYGLNEDVYRRWCNAYEAGTLGATGKKTVAKTKSKTARSVVKKSVKTKKPLFCWFGKKQKTTHQSKAFIKMSKKCDKLARQLKVSKAETARLRKQLTKAKKSA